MRQKIKLLPERLPVANGGVRNMAHRLDRKVVETPDRQAAEARDRRSVVVAVRKRAVKHRRTASARRRMMIRNSMLVVICAITGSTAIVSV
uniref:Uncharacterized protein n=1 Tax=Anopheles maculatus TaxID=74869 RepID=A0A182SKN5_9DIPT